MSTSAFWFTYHNNFFLNKSISMPNKKSSIEFIELFKTKPKQKFTLII